MNPDELSFFNQQLAAMLRDGIPLEGAIKQLCLGMQSGRLKAELTQLETDLNRGQRLADALADRKLPLFYKQMLIIGARANNLPSMLLMLADYYHRLNQIKERLHGLMVYPSIVLGASLVLSITLALMLTAFGQSLSRDVAPGALFQGSLAVRLAPVYGMPIAIGTILVLLVACLAVPRCRVFFHWRLPGFRESALCQFATAMSLMLEQGGSLNESLGLLRELERESPLGRELSLWQSNLAQGSGRITTFAAGSRLIPPLFIWLVANAGEDMAAGFRRAAQWYYDRAVYRVEMLLYAALPVTVLFLGGLILLQLLPVTSVITYLMNSMGSLDL